MEPALAPRYGPRDGSRRLRIAIRAAAIALCVLGVIAAATRATIVAGTLATPAAARPDLSPIDERLLSFMAGAMHLPAGDPEYARARREVVGLAAKYVEHPLTSAMHLLPGILILLLAPLQFSATVRRRHPRVHRWSGRMLLALAAFVALSGFYFGVVNAQVVPFEPPTIVLFSGLFLFAAGRGFIAIRRGDVARHREWMMRMFAMAIGIATVRLVSIVLAFLLRAGYATVGVASMWIGWILTLGVAELWIRHTRRAGIARQTLFASERSSPWMNPPILRPLRRRVHPD